MYDKFFIIKDCQNGKGKIKVYEGTLSDFTVTTIVVDTRLLLGFIILLKAKGYELC